MSRQLYDVYDPTQDDGKTTWVFTAETPEQAVSKFCEKLDNADNCVRDGRVVCVSPYKKCDWTRYRVSAAAVKVVYTATKVEN